MPGLLLLVGCLALSACSPDPVTRWVTDNAGLLDADMEQRLSVRLADAQRNYGPQLVVMTTRSLKGQSIEDYSLDLATRSGLGDKSRNDGLLLVVAPNERKVRIEVGTGLETTFTDAYAQMVIHETLLPNFKAGRFQNGIQAAVDQLIGKMRQAHADGAANDNGRAEPQKDAG
jgi:uncharacterized protein